MVGGWRPKLGEWTIAECHCSVPWWRRGGCHSSVLWLGGKVTTKFGGVDVVPLQGAIAMCCGGGGPSSRSGRGAIAGCHCSVLGEGRVTINFGGWTWCNCWVVVCYGWGGGDDQAEWSTIAGCQSLFHIFILFSRPPISPRQRRKQQWILSWASCRRCTVLYVDNPKNGFCYLGSMLV